MQPVTIIGTFGRKEGPPRSHHRQPQIATKRCATWTVEALDIDNSAAPPRYPLA